MTNYPLTGVVGVTSPVFKFVPIISSESVKLAL